MSNYPVSNYLLVKRTSQLLIDFLLILRFFFIVFIEIAGLFLLRQNLKKFDLFRFDSQIRLIDSNGYDSIFD